MTPDEITKFLATVPALPVEKKVKLYLKLRAAKAAATKEYEAKDAEYKTIMTAVENYMLADADKSGVTGFTTPFGTTYTAETKKISIADESAFFDFIKEKGDLEFLERRVSTAHVDAYMKLTEGTPPPGLNIFRERVMRVRKASEK